MQSHGGVAPVRESTRLAAGAVLSGPAGGVAAGRYSARLLSEANLITFDMGGTSTDIALLQGGEPQLTGEKTVGVAKVALPAIDIHTLGAGGGSVAWVDAGRILHVGPESAGAEPVPAVLSAWGMLATDLRYELVRSHVSEVGRMTAAGLRRLFAALERDGRKRLARFDGPISVRRGLDMRYGEQIFEIQVDLDGVDLGASDLLDQVAERFHRRHEELYAYSAPGQEVVIVNARVAVAGALPVLPAEGQAAAGRAAAGPGRRRVWLGDWVEVPVWKLDALAAGHEVKGPAIFESATTTVLAREGERVTVTRHGWLDIRIA